MPEPTGVNVRMDKTDIGFIGLGHMGSGMVKSLIRNGWPVVVHDQRTQARVDGLMLKGNPGGMVTVLRK